MINPISFSGIYKFMPNGKQANNDCKELCENLQHNYNGKLAAYMEKGINGREKQVAITMVVPDECTPEVEKYCANKGIEFERIEH